MQLIRIIKPFQFVFLNKILKYIKKLFPGKYKKYLPIENGNIIACNKAWD